MFTQQGYWLSPHAEAGLRRANRTIDDVDIVIALGTSELVKGGRRKYYFGRYVVDMQLTAGLDYSYLLGLTLVLSVESRTIVTVFYDNNNGVVQQRLAVNSYKK